MTSLCDGYKLGLMNENSNKACLFAYAIDTSGKATPADPATVSENLVWIHLDARHNGVRALLEKIPGIDTISATSLLAAETRPRLEKIGGGLLIILRGANLNENARPEDMVSLRLFLDSRHAVTLRRRKSRAVDDMEAEVRSGRGPSTAGTFLATLCAHILDRVEPILTGLDDRLDQIEEKILKDPKSVARADVTRIRQQAIMFRRHMTPQRDVMGQIKLLDDGWLSAADRRTLHEAHDRITRFVEELDSLRDRCQIAHEELITLFSEKLNKNMYRLSVVSVMFLPLSFLTGLFGTNLGGIPGASHPLAFPVFCALLALSVPLVAFFLKKRGWI